MCITFPKTLVPAHSDIISLHFDARDLSPFFIIGIIQERFLITGKEAMFRRKLDKTGVHKVLGFCDMFLCFDYSDYFVRSFRLAMCVKERINDTEANSEPMTVLN